MDIGTGRILSGISLDIVHGEAVALLGANGSGKTTLVKALLGLAPLSVGRAELYGVDIAARRSLPWSRIGYVPQRVGSSAGVPATAAEVVASGLLTNRRLRPGRGSRGRVMAALAQVSLAERASDSVQVFSGGQQQRVLIARALVRDPDLLIIDEPLAGIDRASKHDLAATLTGLQRSGTTILVVLHDLAELETMISRALILDHGQVAHDGPPVPPAAGHGGHEHFHPPETPLPPVYAVPDLRIGGGPR